MADGDQRIEVLEDEMKVLKGEVSRTLVDLRALLMQEESPLMTGALTNRARSSGEASVVTQVTLAPAPAPTIEIAAPAPPDEAPSALAGLPALGEIEMPEPPGSPDEGTVPSLEPESPAVPDAPLVEAPAAADTSLPTAPAAGDFSLPDASPGPAPQADAERVNEAEDEQREERLRARKARLKEEETLAEAEAALRARKRESDLQEEAAEQEARNRRKKREQEDSEEPKTVSKPKPKRTSDPVEELKSAQLQDTENEERLRQRTTRLREEQELDESERTINNRKKEREQEEEQALQASRERRKKQAQEEDEELEERSRRRKRERAEEEEYQDSRGPRMDRGPQMDGRSEQLDRLERLERADQMERLERLEAQGRRSREDEDRSAGPDRWDRGTLPSEEMDQQMDGQYEDESQDEFEHLEGVRRRDRDLEEEMENFSESGMSEGDLGPDVDSGPGMGSLDLGSDDDLSVMGPGPAETGLDDPEDDEFSPGENLGLREPGTGEDDESGPAENLGLLQPGAREDGEDQDPEYDLEFGLESGRGDEMDARPGDGGDDDHSDDWDDQAEPSSPQRHPLDNYDSHDYQEGPKINGNKGSRRPRDPEVGRRRYESDRDYPDSYGPDSYGQDSYYPGGPYDDRAPAYGRRPQNPPRTQRAPRPSRREPMDRRPPTGNYGYAPSGGNRRWGPEYERWPDPQDWAPEPPPMDLNLVSNLVRWASMAKFRVGEKRLTDIIELYVESRNAPPGLSQALKHIASIVDDQQPESGQTAQETMDLIAHLHGILTASLQVPTVPLINVQGGFTAGDRGSTGGSGSSSSSGNGDW